MDRSLIFACGVAALAVGSGLAAGIAGAVPLTSSGDAITLPGTCDGHRCGQRPLATTTVAVAIAEEAIPFPTTLLSAVGRGGRMVSVAAVNPDVGSDALKRLAEQATGSVKLPNAITFGFEWNDADVLDLRFPGASRGDLDWRVRIPFPESGTSRVGELDPLPILRRR